MTKITEERLIESHWFKIGDEALAMPSYQHEQTGFVLDYDEDVWFVGTFYGDRDDQYINMPVLSMEDIEIVVNMICRAMNFKINEV